ncbi:uncharacterized protein NPIL_35681 [Nephila pilipes]|uniref:IGFBP N-terminal domain-containing protein n=1 Tax=Nephila pilipes TaxID=299642 RepID=A0A8X6UC83_NEPPI|nr:uncharacterized protein NPIL_35681 [Nephila pilipes]
MNPPSTKRSRGALLRINVGGKVSEYHNLGSVSGKGVSGGQESRLRRILEFPLLNFKLILMFTLCSSFFCVGKKDECTPGFCEIMHCESLTGCEFPNSYIKRKGELCGCCDKCMMVKTEGEICNPVFNELIPPKIICAPGLECHENTLRCCKITPPKPLTSTTYAEDNMEVENSNSYSEENDDSAYEYGLDSL